MFREAVAFRCDRKDGLHMPRFKLSCNFFFTSVTFSPRHSLISKCKVLRLSSQMDSETWLPCSPNPLKQFRSSVFYSIRQRSLISQRHAQKLRSLSCFPLLLLITLCVISASQHMAPCSFPSCEEEECIRGEGRARVRDGQFAWEDQEIALLLTSYSRESTHRAFFCVSGALVFFAPLSPFAWL